MIATDPMKFVWHDGPILPRPLKYDYVVLLCWFVLPDDTWLFLQVYAQKASDGRLYWARQDRSPIDPEAVRWFAIVRDQPFASFTPNDLAKMHAEVSRREPQPPSHADLRERQCGEREAGQAPGEPMPTARDAAQYPGLARGVGGAGHTYARFESFFRT